MAYDDIKVEVFIQFLYPNMMLKGDGYDENGVKVIDKGEVISEEKISKLKINGVKKITYTRERLKLKKSVSSSAIPDVHLERAMNIVNDIEGSLRSGSKELPESEIKEIVNDFISDIRENGDACLNLLDIADYDDYTYSHSINVSTLCVTMGFALNLDEHKISHLGIAGLLHDVGKTMIPIEVINKKEKLTDQEWTIIKKHPVFGYNILKAEGQFNMAVMNAILLHHENYKGKGYPFGFTNEKINAFAQVVSVSDVFDAITSQRSYKDAKSYSEAFNYIMENSGIKFHPKIAQVFLRDLIKKINEEALYPENSYVILDTGEIAYVVGHRQSIYTLRPIVEIFFNSKTQELLKFPRQIDLENDYKRSVVKRIQDKTLINKFNSLLNRELG